MAHCILYRPPICTSIIFQRLTASLDRQQPAEFLVNSEGAEAEGLFDDLEIVLNAPDPRSRNRRAINSR